MTYLSHQDGEHTGRTSWELAEKLLFLDSDINILNGRLRRLAHVLRVVDGRHHCLGLGR